MESFYDYADARDTYDEEKTKPAIEAIKRACSFVDIDDDGEYSHSIEVTVWQDHEYASYDVEVKFDLPDELEEKEKQKYLEKIYAITEVTA